MLSALKATLATLYGIYALAALAPCFLVAGSILLLTPGERRRRQVARVGLRVGFLLAGVPFRSRGMANIPAGRCVAIANHRSYLDGLAVIAALPPRFRAVIRFGPDRVPVMGLVLRRVGALFLDRDFPKRAAVGTRHLLDALEAGDSLCIFPEGTFSADGGLLPFQTGAFFLAAETDVPVVPVAIQGTGRILPESAILPHPGALDVRALPPQSPQGRDRAAAAALRDRCEDVLWEGLRPQAVAAPEPGQMPDYEYYRGVLAEQRLPLAYLDLDLLEHSMRDALDASRGKTLRVDARALACPDLVSRILRSHPRFYGATCATIDEALYIADECQVGDVLVANPTLQQHAVARVCQQAGAGQITLTADSIAHLKCLGDAAEEAGVRLPVCVEMDLSDQRSGRRSPVRHAEQLLALVETIGEHENLRFRGLLIFDAPPGASQRRRNRNRVDANGLDARDRARHERRAAVLQRLDEAGHAPELVQASGHAGLERDSHDASVTEISLGTAFFRLGAGSEQDGATRTPVAGFAAEIARQPATHLFVCPGVGARAPDSLAVDALPHPCLPSDAFLEGVQGVSQAQFVVRSERGLQVGQPLFFAYPDAGELCEHFSRLLLIEDGAIADTAATYRGLADVF